MFIVGIGTALPSRRYLQEEGWEAVQKAPQFSQLTLRSRAILKKVLLGQNGIRSRFLALEALEEAFDLNPDTLHARFKTHAPALATEAASKALADCNLKPGDIDALLISTCTGYLCPGLTSYVSERLGLRSGILSLDLVGQGCVAALPNLRTAHALLESGGYSRVLSICVEICSAAFYMDDDPGVLISACLFGDAAGAAVLSNAPDASRRSIRWTSAGSLLDAKSRDLLRFDARGGLLRNILSPEVPSIAASHARNVFAGVSDAMGIAQRDVKAWIWHTGGRDVLLALQKKFGLTASDMEWSARVLRDLGNVSSSCVYHVLKVALDNKAPAGWWWMSSFGAGFSCQGAMLEVGEP